MRSGSPFSPLTTRWSSQTFSARVLGREESTSSAGVFMALLLKLAVRPTMDSATRRGSERGLVAAAKKEHDPHDVRLPPLRRPMTRRDTLLFTRIIERHRMTADHARFATRAVHAARTRDSAAARATPIYLTAGFEFDDFDHAADHFGTGAGFGYTRTGNPTVRAVERQIAALESGADALLVASGQAAVVTALLTVAGAGDHIVSSTHIYEGSRGLFLDNLSRLGIETTFVDDIADPDAWRAAIRPNTRALFAESI